MLYIIRKFWRSLFAPQPSGDFDIEGVRVFFIERDADQTIIGFWAGENSTDTEEWSLKCDLTKHEELVRRFRIKGSLPNR